MTKLMLKEFLEKTPAINVKFQNLTSETKVLGEIEMLTVGIDNCTLKLPKSSCSKGHQALLTFQTKALKIKKIEVVGKIIELNNLAEEKVEAKIQFTQFVREEWQQFLNLFNEKQKIITTIVETLKTPKE